MKRVITNADDYGYRPEVSAAIIEAHTSGVLTSTTVLINIISREEVELAKQHSSLGFGLHLNLTSGKALTPNWVEKYGDFLRPERNQPRQFDRELWIPFFSKYTTEDVYLEYKAQIEKFVSDFGTVPTHLDSHHYTSAFENVFPAFVRIAKEYDLPVRRQVMYDFAANQHPMGNLDHAAEMNRRLREEGVKTADYFSLLYFERYENYLAVIENELGKITDEQTIELSWHPGNEEDWRKKNLQILKDEKLRQLFSEQGCELINYSDI